MTLGDLERLLSEEFREIARVRCQVDWETKTVCAVVLMRDFENRQTAFERRRGELSRLIEERSGLTERGLRCEIRQPDFISVRATVWLRGHTESPAELVREAVSALERFLHPVKGGFDGGGWPVGLLPLKDQVSACLRLALPDFTVEELILSRYYPEDGSEQELNLYRDNPFAVALSGPHAVHLHLKETAWG